MIVSPEGRWPPVYDEDDLRAQIRRLTSGDFEATFWDLREPRGVCQGDVVNLRSAVPVLDEEGAAVVTDDCDLWLVIGNTCDFERTIADVRWSQLVPLVDVPNASGTEIGMFRAYTTSRHFYVPPLPGGDQVHRLADFTRPVTIHKGAFDGAARVVAHMQFPAWVLLHSCLIRFLARGDGRNEP